MILTQTKLSKLNQIETEALRAAVVFYGGSPYGKN